MTNINSKNTDIVELASTCKEFLVGEENYPEFQNYAISVAGYTRASDHYFIKRQFKDTHLLVLTTQGRGDYSISGLHSTVRSNDVLFIPANTQFEYQLSGKNWEIYWFMLHKTNIWRNFPEQFTKLSNQLLSAVTRVYSLLIEEQFSPAFSSVRTGLTQTLSAYLHRVCDIDQNNVIDHRISTLHCEVLKDFKRQWTLAELSKTANLSRSHLQRLCHEHYQCAPMQFVYRIKLQRAALLLKVTTAPIKQIAFDVGFPNPYHFSTAFRRAYNISPANFRLKHSGVN